MLKIIFQKSPWIVGTPGPIIYTTPNTAIVTSDLDTSDPASVTASNFISRNFWYCCHPEGHSQQNKRRKKHSWKVGHRRAVRAPDVPVDRRCVQSQSQKYRKEPAEIRCQDFKKKNLESPWLTKPLRIHGMLDRPEATSAKQNVSCSHFANRAKRDNTSLNTHFDKNSSIWSWSFLLRHVCRSASSWSDTECLKGQFGYAEAFDVCWMNHDHNSMCSKTHHRKANMWSSKWIVNVRRQHFCLDASSSQVSYLEVQNESPACTKHQSHSVAGEMSSLRFILWKITSNIDQWE